MAAVKVNEDIKEEENDASTSSVERAGIKQKHCDVVKVQSSQMRLFEAIFKHYARSLDDAATFMPRLPDSNLEWLICVLLSVSQRFSIRFPPFPIGHQ